MEIQRYVKNKNNTFNLVTLFRRKEPILIKEEKEWLKNIISGFTTKILYIKVDHFNKWLNIKTENNLYTIVYNEDLKFNFENMTNNQEYTLEELSL